VSSKVPLKSPITTLSVVVGAALSVGFAVVSVALAVVSATVVSFVVVLVGALGSSGIGAVVDEGFGAVVSSDVSRETDEVDFVTSFSDNAVTSGFAYEVPPFDPLLSVVIVVSDPD
jgi:hypothetical protein